MHPQLKLLTSGGVCLLALSFAFLQFRSQQTLVEHAASEDRKLETLVIRNKQLIELMQRSRSPGAFEAISQPTVSKLSPQRQPSRQPARPSDPFAFTMLFPNNPLFHNTYLSAYRSALPLDFALFFKRANLSQDAIDKFNTILDKSMTDFTDIRSAAAATGLEQTDSALHALDKKRTEDRAASIKQLLGDEGYNQYIDYVQTSVERARIYNIAALLSNTETPLSPIQVDELTGILAAARLSPKTTGGTTIYPMAGDYDAASGAARAILAPPQFTAFQMLIDSQRAQNELARYSRAQNGP
jgi:hypothetical protein